MNRRVFAIATILALSGMCALIYQVAWMRQFRLVFGASHAASSAVLAIFMGGLGLGNALLGHRADRQSNPLRFYALLELLIAVTAAASPMLIEVVRSLYIAIGGQSALGETGATAVRLVLSSLVLAAPTILMGGTLPAAAAAATTDDDPNRRSVAVLYGINTFGAVIGASISTFYLLEVFGTRSTLWLACLVNLVAAAAAYLLSKSAAPVRVTRGRPTAEEADGNESPAEPTWDVRWMPRFVYAAACIVGFTFFLMELVWFRMLGPLLGGTTFTFGLILAVALIGIGIGGAIFAAWFRDAQPTVRGFALTCGLEALAVIFPFVLGDRIAVLAHVLRGMSVFGFSGEIIAWSCIAATVILPAAIISGVQFPLLIALVGRGQHNVGRQVGNAFAWNTVGAIAGSLAGGFGVLPALTAPVTWRLSVGLLLALGLAAWLLALRREARTLGLWAQAAVLGAAAVCLAAPGPTAVWRHSGIGAGRAILPNLNHNTVKNWMNEAQRSVVREYEGVEISIAINDQNGYSFIANGKSDGNAVGDADTCIVSGLIGTLLHPNPKTCLVVGLGTGETAGWIADVDSIERVDVVELEPVIRDVAELCSVANRNLLENPKLNLIYNDAREVLLTTDDHYDMIVSYPSNPFRAGIAGLFTREYYASIKERLADDGLFLQWMQAYEVDAQTVGTVLATLRSEFPYVEVWQTTEPDMLLICSKQPLRHDVDEMRRRLTQEPHKSGLAQIWQAHDLEGVYARFVGDSDLVNLVSEQMRGMINTDDKNFLEYGSARTAGRSTGFSISGLREQSVVRRTHRPEVLGEVDWESVEDQRLAMYFIRYRIAIPRPYFNKDQVTRASALNSYLLGDMAGTVATWAKQPQPPRNQIEITALARAYATLGDARAEPLIKQLESLSPLDAEAVRAMVHHRNGNLPELAKSLTKILTALRNDPWPKFIGEVFGLAQEVARRDPTLARSMYEALDQPLALHLLNDPRRLTQFEIVKTLDDATLAGYIGSFEPFVPWNQEFLETRARVYAATNDPRSPAAERDLAEFRRNISGGALLPVAGKKVAAAE